MDDHTFCLLRSLDDQIRRAAILIEQHARCVPAHCSEERLKDASRRRGSPALLSQCSPH